MNVRFFYAYLTKGLCTLFCLALMQTACAQLKADFTVDTAKGCSPLTVSFTNTTSGASAAATYLWNLGNGNTSDKRDVQAVYTEAKTYTITLTVKDGNQTNAKSMTITVYKNPVVDFGANPIKGCAPAEITFTSNSTAGDGTITNYFWDFGDGTTSPGATLQTAKHRYTFAQKPPVKLTVTNSHGCYATAEKGGLVEITQGIRIAFTASNTTLCALPQAVSFANTTTGPGTLSYAWDFGNGQTATEKAPAGITFSKKGTYPVKLKVTSSEGCSDSLVKTDYINAANFTSDFEQPSSFCTQQSLQFVNKSQPAPAQSLWKFSDDNATQTALNASHTYSKAGNFQVQLINTFGTCKDTATKSFSISTAPLLPGFITDKTGACKAPLSVSFEDTSSKAVSWKWNFGTGIAADTSNQKKTSFTFDRLGDFNVLLTVSNAAGCAASASKFINIKRPNVTITYTKSSSTYGLYGCPGLTIKFKANPDNEVKEYRWDFGDGGTSTAPEPEHRFDSVGRFTIKLFYKTAGGCEDSVFAHNYVNTYRKPKPDFESLSGLTICGNAPVQFKDLTDTANGWKWDFGDGGTSTEKNPVHSYGSEGQFTVTLISFNQYCSDTTKKPQFIKLVPPFTDISSSPVKSCSEKGKVTFRQSTQGATEWVWDFGDGSATETYTENRERVTHTYTKSGVYKVILYASNATCTTYDTMHISIMVKQRPVLSLDKNQLCGSDTLSLKISGMDTIRYYYEPNRQVYSYPYSGRVVYSDGTVHSYLTSSWYPPEYTQKLTNFRPGTDSIRIITYDGVNGCYDTSNFIRLNVSGPVADFRVTNKVYCAGAAVTFTDASEATGGVAIKQWLWDFGDGQKDTLTFTATVIHKYRGANYFYPKLKVVDANGCFAQTDQFGTYVTVYGPVANFYTNDTLVQPNTSVQFVNTTNTWPNYPVTYTWDFGDGSAKSSETAPAHVYTKSGVYTVKLVAKSSFGCADSLVRVAYVEVKTVRADFTLTSSYVNNNSCPPLLARFQNTSVNADSIFWDFGDESYADNAQTPSHTYYQPGVYQVKLYAFAQGAVDTSVQELMVNGPYGTITPSALLGCSPTEITLTAAAKNAVSFTWDFNDGYVAQGSDTLAKHAYTKAGVYLPKVILKDASGCAATYLLKDSIIIDKLTTQFDAGTRLICDSATVTFKSSVTNFGSDSLKVPLHYKWEFGNAKDTSNQPNPSFNFTKLGKYPVRLTTTSVYGCTQTVVDTIAVLAKPKSAIAAVDGTCINQSFAVKDVAAHRQGETWMWRFGDGRSSDKEQPDSLQFSKPGRYTITLIKSNSNGCTDTARHTLVADNLEATPLLDRKLICDLGTVQFTGKLSSYARDSLGASLNYLWEFGTGNRQDTARRAQAAFTYAKPQTYGVQFSVNSPYGCRASVVDTVRVLKTPRASIQSQDALCAENSIRFTGRATDTTNIRWAWDFGQGEQSAEKDPPVQTYAATGTYAVKLVIYNNPACPDTAVKALVVHPKPEVALSPGDQTICRGDSLTLRAHDGVLYQWTSTGGNLPFNTDAITVAPTGNTVYNINVTNQFGCTNQDSVRIAVSQPFSIEARAENPIICATHLVQLQASGAVRYQWIPAEVSNPNVADPVARPLSTTTYTVVGFGADQCFTDTATVRVEVIPLPTVDAGADTTVLWGSEVRLLARTSNDVTGILWSPPDYLNCTTCTTPVSKPQKNVEYVVRVRNGFGCTAADSIKINLQCTLATVHIPNAFTPNGDGLNDLFYVKGGGMKTIKSLRIFNRWGEVVFARSNFQMDDKNSAWDGTFKGRPLPSETYVYIAEMSCADNQPFQLKGTVTLIR